MRRRVDGVLLLDKPAGISSNAALQKARWLFNAEKAGHTGTLDPLATGLLPLCFGEATKFAGELLDARKRYLATVRLGVVTDSADAEGTVLATYPVSATQDDVLGLLPRFMGDIEQVPPMHSALKRDGTPLYALARQGIEVERAPRRVSIHALQLLDWRGDTFDLEVDCSKGTYVRTLASDLGSALGCGAHLAALRRTRVGTLDLASAVTLDHIEALPLSARDSLLLPVDTLLVGLPRIKIGVEDAARLRQGQPINMRGTVDDGLQNILHDTPHDTPHDTTSCRCRLFGPEGFMGLGECLADGRIQPKRLVVTR